MTQSLENVTTNQQLVEAALLADTAVDDCIILNRKLTTSQQETVAYIVSAEMFAPARLKSCLKELPTNLLPKVYVPLTNLPLTATGQIDEDVLASIDVADFDLARRWEEHLHLLPEIDQVAVVVQEYAPSIEPLHLSDLLFHQKAATVTQVEVTSSHVQESDAVTLPKLKISAIAHGGCLPDEPNAPATLQSALQRAAKQSLEKNITYLSADGTDITQSYADLLGAAERIFAGLKALGLKPQDQVILQLELSHDLIPAFWGCLLGGFIPAIAPVAPTYSEPGGAVDKLCSLWQLLDEPLILTCAALQKSVQSLSQWLPKEKLQIAAIETLRTSQPEKNYHPSQPDDVAFFNLTSGSTGTPKCIMLTHRNIISRARGTNQLCHHKSDDVILNWLPFDHIGSISDWHLRCVYLGCKLVYAPKEYVLARPLNWLDLIDKYRIAHSWAPNFAYALVNDALKQERDKHWDLSCVKALLTAGEAVSSGAVEDFIANLATYGFKKTAIRPAFGMAEMGSGITYAQSEDESSPRFHTVDKASLTGEIARVTLAHPNSTTFTDLGPVIASVSIRIVDSENALLTEDTIGNLQVSGDAVSPGYYKNPAVNQEVFLADGWFNTGDLGFITKGHLVVTGRAKETIIINGANYYNHEIEAVVEAVEGVEVSYTAACAVQSLGSATEKLAIFFSSPYSGNALIEVLKQIRDRVLQQVAVNPDYLIPVAQSAIPKTAIGKIQRSQLSKRFEAGEFDRILKQIDIDSGNNTLPNWFYRKIWRPKAARIFTSPTATGTSLVFLDRLGLGKFLCSHLSQSNRCCIGVEIGETFARLTPNYYIIDPQNPEHYEQLLSTLAADSLPIDQIVHLWTYEKLGADITRLEVLEQAQERGSYSLLFLIQALNKLQNPKQLVRLLVVSSHTQATSPEEAIACEHTPILGLIKTIPQELPQIDCRHLDLSVEQVEVNAAFIVQELQVAQIETEVAYRHTQRLVPRLEIVDILQATNQQIPFKTGGMYIISGGLGGIGVEIAKYLLHDYSARLLLIGRSPLPPENQWQKYLESNDPIAQRIENYLALKQLGRDILYQAVDICDLGQLQQAVTQAKSRWGCELDGIIHLAGSVQTRLLIEETRSSFTANLQAKVSGTWGLHQLVKSQPNSIFIAFSSVNGFFGGKTVGAYSAANSFLDLFSHYQRNQCQLSSYCFSWSMWDEVGMSRGFQMKELSRAQGYYAIAAKQGLQSLQVGLQQNRGQLLIGLDGSNRKIRRYVETQSPRLQQLAAYFTTKAKANLHQPWENLQVQDRFGIPSNCTFQQLKEMPLTLAGKIDREQLATLSLKVNTERVMPRTDIERRLATIWQELLGVSSVGIGDNFFALGGSSVLAARLFAQIENVFGKSFALAILFQAPTIEQLAHLLSEQEFSPSWSCLVPIQPDGAKPPLFCVHGSGGNVLVFRRLAQYLGVEQPLYGLQAQGLDGKQPLLTSIEDMAERYLTEIQELQPTGPYFLGGYSLGGLVALAIAQKLQAQGQQVAFLSLFDTYTPKLLPNPQQAITGKFSRHWDRLRNLQPQEQLLYLVDKAKGKGKTIQQKLQKAIYKFYQKIGRSLPQEQRNALLWDVNERAARAYQPATYSGQLTLYRAGGGSDDLGWQEFVDHKLDIYQVPGKHNDVESEGMLTEPHVKVVAAKLKICLEQVQTYSSKSK